MDDSKEICSIFKDKKKQLDLIQKFQPGFLKFDEEGKIEINRSVPLNINLDKIIFSQENKHESGTDKTENNMNAILSSRRKINSNINLNKSIKNIFNINFANNFDFEDNNILNEETKTLHYQHLIKNYFIKVSIPQNEFKLEENIKQEFRNAMQKKDDNEKMKELLKVYNKYGVGISFEFMLGGKYYIDFDAKNTEEKEEIVRNFDNLTNLSMNVQKMDLDLENKKGKEIKKKMENLNIKVNVLGGNPEKKDDYNEWAKSLNLSNLEIIEYKSIIPLHEYCDDDIKNEIEGLLERENKRKIEEEKKAKIEKNKKIEEKTDLDTNNEDDDDNFEQITIYFLGDNGSGKTSIIKKYIKGTFNSVEKSTVSLKFYNKNKVIQEDNKKYKVKVFLAENAVSTDNISQLNLSYINGCDGIILVLDISNKDSFKRLKTWKNAIYNYKKKSCNIFLIPNKADLKKSKTKSPLNLCNFCEENKIVLMQAISCKDDPKEKLKANIDQIVKKIFIDKERMSIRVKEEEKYKNSSCFN